MNLGQNTSTMNSRIVIKSNLVNPHTDTVRPFVLNVSEFNINEGDVTVQKTFLDDVGQPDILRVHENGLVWDRSNPNHAKNIELLTQLLKENWDIRQCVKIEDEDQVALASAGNTLMISEAIEKIKSAMNGNKSELLYGLARLFMKEAKEQTMPVIYKFLLDKAVADPKLLLEALQDGDFELKINVLKAIDYRFIEKSNDGIYKINGGIVANTFDSLVYYLKDNEDIARGLMHRIKGVVSPLSESTRVPAATDVKEEATEVKINTPEEEIVKKEGKMLNLLSQVTRFMDIGLLEQNEEGYSYSGILLGTDKKSIAESIFLNPSIETRLRELYKTKKGSQGE